MKPGTVLYRLLLLAFPADFRRRFRDDMVETFVDRHRLVRARGLSALAHLWLRTIVDLITHGLAERRAARLARSGRSVMLQQLAQDVRYAARTYRRRPGFTAVALVTLALGIGANTAIFSVVHAVLIRDLPYPEPDRLVRIYGTYPRFGIDHNVVSPFDIDYWEQHATTLAALAPTRGGSVTLTGAGDPVQLQRLLTTPSFFEVMATRPAIGRPFSDDEARLGDRVVVISHALWTNRFSARADITGRTIALDDEPWTVVGVMPRSFRHPENADLWMPVHLSASDRTSLGSYFLGSIARLKPGVTVAAAQGDLDRIAAAIGAAHPKQRGERGYLVIGLREDLGLRAADGLWILQGTVVVVLLIACANVANLLLVGAAARRREFAVRAAVGGSRWRLVRQSLTESVTLAMLGAGLGAVIAVWGVRGLVAMAPPALLPSPETIGVSWTVLLFTAIVAGTTGLLFGVAPALLSASPNVTGALKDGLRTMAGGLAWSRRQWLRGGLVLAEVALALILLAGAGLLVRSFALLLAQPPGFDTGNLLTAQVDLPAARYDTPEARRRFWLDLTARLETLPGVVSAGASNALPFSYMEWQTGFQVREREDVPNEGAGSRTVTAGLFETLGIPLLQGRRFAGDDTATSEPVVIVSDVFAREHLPDGSPIGQQIRFSRSADGPWHTVVGVVGATRHLGLTEAPRAEIYRPVTQNPDQRFVLMAVRTRVDPASLSRDLERAVHEIDAKLPVLSIMTMDDLVARRMAQRRFYMQLLSLFAGLAAVLAATGIYGVMSFLVAEGRREIGIRVALGARRARVIGLVLGQGLRVAAIGCAVGLAGAWWLSSVLEEQVFGITPQDPATLATVAVGLLAVAALACWIPASRSSRVDPADVMRVE